MYSKKLLAVACGLAIITLISAQNFGLKVVSDNINYTPDDKGNRILDFSFCGYKSSELPIPTLRNEIFVPHMEGDATTTIQRAIDYVSALKPDANGYRGAVLLDNGTFTLQNSVTIASSGVVLRGKSKPETILFKKGFDRDGIIKIEGQTNIRYTDTCAVADSYVPVNRTTFAVSSIKNLKAGDRIKIHRPSTKEWIASVKCDIYGGGESALGWKPGDTDLFWDRTITAVYGNTITIDVPLTVALDKQFGITKVYKYKWDGRITNAGVENLTVVSDYDKKYPKDENHAWTGISVDNAENCWVRHINFRYLAGSAVILQPGSSRITIEDCISKNPVSEIGGFRRVVFYNFGQMNLVQRCYSEQGIHDFAVGYTAAGPNAFVQCDSKESLGFSGPIDAWSCGVLYDIVNIDGHNLAFKNLGQSKNGAGWNTGNSMFWQCTAAEIECYSPAADAKNRAYGSWSQYSGDGEWTESDNHVQPRSLYYAQLSLRLNKNTDTLARILPRPTNASSSPTVAQAEEMVIEARKPRLTLENWINQSTIEQIKPENLLTVNQLKDNRKNSTIKTPVFSITDGRILCDGKLITGSKTDVQWWSGKTKFNHLSKMKPHVTRFVPGREGLGLTDRIDSVISFMNANNIAVLDHNYGLWTDRRRDDHLRVRRRDGDTWAPFYEQPFARSGVETAWDGLSKYDLYRPNEWYWFRLKEFAQKAQQNGKLLFYQHFFQHNIIEAGAHWVDSPWRTANNINNTGFPEPVNFAGDKRVFMAEYFYDISNENRRNAYSNYIRHSLNAFANNPNVIHFISAEYTGPLHFVEFWLDEIDKWEKETGKNALVALSCTKDVQDSILADTKRRDLVEIIDIRYWHYKADGSTYAPKGGVNLAPRQHARLEKTGSVGYTEAFKAVNEYKNKFPDKAITYYSQNYPEMALAVLAAGGSLPALNINNEKLTRFLSKKQKELVKTDTFSALLNSDNNFMVITNKNNEKIQLNAPKGTYKITFIDSKSGNETFITKTTNKGQTIEYLNIEKCSGIFIFERSR